MARRIKSRKSKHLGNRSFGGGNTKNRRGKGNRGGKGRAGYHKHKWLHTIKYEGTNKVNRGIQGFSNPSRKSFKTVSLGDLYLKLSTFPKNAEGVYQIELRGASVVSGGAFDAKAHVKASRFSAPAIKAIEKAGGKAETF